MSHTPKSLTGKNIIWPIKWQAQWSILQSSHLHGIYRGCRRGNPLQLTLILCIYIYLYMIHTHMHTCIYTYTCTYTYTYIRRTFTYPTALGRQETSALCVRVCVCVFVLLGEGWWVEKRLKWAALLIVREIRVEQICPPRN